MADIIRSLSIDTIKIINCSQVITSVSSVIKELLENSLDAEATIISVKLEKYGYDRLEVKDNGNGINAEDMKIIAKPHTTSKLSSYEDLDNLTSYGFRGEALSSLCSISDLSIATKGKNEPVAYKYEFNSNGDIIQTTPVALKGGTCVTVANLFKNTPVRKIYYSNVKRRKNDLKKIEELVTAFAIIQPKIYISLVHDRATIFQKNSVDTPGNAVLSVFRESSRKLRECFKSSQEGSLHVWLPDKKYSKDDACTRTSADSLFIFINERPVIVKAAEKLIKKYFGAKNELSRAKYPVGVVITKVAPNSIDVNLEPNKDRVNLLNEGVILNLLKSILIELYGTTDCQNEIIPCAPSFTPVSPEGKSNSTKSTTSFMPECITSLCKSDYLIGDEMALLGRETDRLSSLENTNIPDALYESLLQGDENINKIPASIVVNPVGKSMSPVTRFEDDVNTNSNLTSIELASIFDVENELIQRQDNNSFANIESNPTPDDCSEKMFIAEISENNPTVSDYSKKMGISENRENNPTLDNSKINEGKFNLDLCTEKNPTPQNASTNNTIRDTNVSNPNILKDTVNNLDNTVPRSNKHSHSVGTPISADTWSRGHIVAGGGNIQNVRILSAPKRPFSNLDTSTTSIGDGFNREAKTVSSKKPRLMPIKLNAIPSPAGMNVKKPSSAFALFAKDIRHDIFANNPGVSFTFVGQEISKRWREIDSRTREIYEQKSLDERNCFSDETRASKPCRISSVADISVNSNTSIGNLERMLAPTTPQLTKRTSLRNDALCQRQLKNKQLMVPFSMQDIKERCMKRCSIKIEDCIIGKLRNNVGWLYLNDRKLSCINVWRMNEIILYESLMQNYDFCCSTLHEPIQLNERYTGVTEWNTLLSLERTKQTFTNSYTVVDRRISFSGFQVALYPNSNGQMTSGEITDVTSAVGFYGLSDLCEVLSYLANKMDASLSECRPSKLKDYIKDECIRMTKSSSNIIDSETLSAKLVSLRKQSNCSICLHSKPMLSPLFDLTTVLENHE